jgi:Mg2+ and Co2+ transporter CorA
MAAPFQTDENSGHGDIWKAIGDLQKDVRATREDVAYIRGAIDQKKTNEDRSISWKQTIISGIFTAVIAFLTTFITGRAN